MATGAQNFDDYMTDDDSDELMDEAIAVVTEANKASASLLQRRLKVGYARAARLWISWKTPASSVPATAQNPAT